MKRIYLLLLMTGICFFSEAQEGNKKEGYTQTIRGKVLDQVSKTGIPGASVLILNSDPLQGTTTGPEGDFVLQDVPTGRISLQISSLGYESAMLREITVTSGKEIVLNIALQESLLQLSEVVVSDKGKPVEARNEMAMVSARGFDMEETNRYAGSRSDPARMAQNFAGVSGANDSRNDIIIRGNSPTGVLWRLEGVDIPNPNHFGALGTTGGPVSMLNNNLLGKSDFLTGAFPAQYGNATAGVFDLSMRKGNAFKYEHVFQIGFNGLEIGTEGPLGGKNGASYLLNYRYSTLGLMQELGLSAGTGNATPYFQDLSLKIDLPVKKLGKFSLFAIGGKSNIDLIGAEKDSSSTDLFSEISQNIYNRAKMGVAGLSHTQYYNDRTFGVFSLSADYTFSGNIVDSLATGTREALPFYRNHYALTKYRAQYHFHQKINAGNNYIAGFNYDILGFSLQDSIYRPAKGQFSVLRNTSGYSGLAQGFVQWQHRFSNSLSGTLGLHFQYFSLNGSRQAEPRLGLKYQQNLRSSFHLGYGLHSQLQPIPVYFLEPEAKPGAGEAPSVRTNEHLGFTKSHHLTGGHQYQLSSGIRLKTELYYQYLYDVAVEQKPSSFSMLNAGADFNLPNVDSLINNGYGRNYGMEITLEKNFSGSTYFLLTASLFDSEYKAGDGRWRNTAFNSQYVFNGLFGKEWMIGSQDRILSVDLKSTYAGGQYSTPIDLEASIMANKAVYHEDRAFSVKNPAYFRTDLKINFRLNRKKLTHEWSLDIQNLFNTRNIFRQTYNPMSQQIVKSYQLGIFPVPQYRITF